ncbi:MAG TPA: hypothetical protein VHG51_06615 [Longimicrobiaceae bacterium]|nr:hypothetical protein [Longimicrobiaceae bacterium]
MHTEHLQNVRPSWVAFGWFAAAAVAGLALVGLSAVGILHPTADSGGAWAMLAVLVGFFCGGWLVGWRTGEAPVLHGVGIGLFSLVVWFLANLLASLLGITGWTGFNPTLAAAALLLQIAAAVFGAWYGTHHHALDTAAED